MMPDLPEVLRPALNDDVSAMCHLYVKLKMRPHEFERTIDCFMDRQRKMCEIIKAMECCDRVSRQDRLLWDWVRCDHELHDRPYELVGSAISMRRGLEDIWVYTKHSEVSDLKAAAEEHFNIFRAAFTDFRIGQFYREIPFDAIYNAYHTHYQNAYCRWLRRQHVVI